MEILQKLYQASAAPHTHTDLARHPILKDEGEINDNTVNMLMDWRHSGFSLHNGAKVVRNDEE